MDNLFLSISLVGIALSIWVIPNVYAVAATVLLSIYAAYSGSVSVSSTIIIILLATAGFHFHQRGGEKNGLIRIIIFLVICWALLSERHQGSILSWVSYLEMVKIPHQIIIQLNFEKALTALLVAAYILQPKFSFKYWRKVFSSGLSMLILVYVAFLLPLVILLHTTVGLNIGKQHLTNLLLNLFLLCFTDEIIFRLILQQWLHQILRIRFSNLARWLPIIVVSVLYGLSHIDYGLFIVLLSAFVGSAYGYIYQKSGKIEVAILVHFALSLTSCFFIAFLGRTDFLPVVIY